MCCQSQRDFNHENCRVCYTICVLQSHRGIGLYLQIAASADKQATNSLAHCGFFFPTPVPATIQYIRTLRTYVYNRSGARETPQNPSQARIWGRSPKRTQPKNPESKDSPQKDFTVRKRITVREHKKNREPINRFQVESARSKNRHDVKEANPMVDWPSTKFPLAASANCVYLTDFVDAS